MKKYIFIVGSRGYKFNYGGWETFVTELMKNQTNEEFQYVIPKLSFDKKEDGNIMHTDSVIEPVVYTPKQGFATMFTFTIRSMNRVVNYINDNKIENAIVLLLGCKVGPLIPIWKRKLKNTKFIINPDGLEWKREKWAWWIKQCFKYSEKTCVKYTDACVCDSMAIKSYIDEKYKSYHKPSYYIAFGAYLDIDIHKNEIVKKLWKQYDIKDHEYYLIVGRFVPENNYEVMIKEFMKSKTKKDLVIICNLEENKFYKYLQESTNFMNDKRIKFIGSVYDKEALLYFRRHAYAYIHGHSAGGTNPSLLEALANTKLNILFDVVYNKEVGKDCVLYFSKKDNDLKKVINKAEKLSKTEINKLGIKAKERIMDAYTWESIVTKYEIVFDELLEEKVKKSN